MVYYKYFKTFASCQNLSARAWVWSSSTSFNLKPHHYSCAAADIDWVSPTQCRYYYYYYEGGLGGHILDQFVQSTNTKPNIPGVMAYNWNSQFYIWMDWKWVNISCDISPTPQPHGNWYFGPFWTEIWLYHAIYIFTLFTQVFKQDFRTWKCCFSSNVLPSHCPRAVFVIN